MLAPAAESAPARRLAVAGTILEVAAERQLAQEGRLERRSYIEGRPAGLLKAGRALGIAGTVIATTLGRRSAAAARLGGLALMAGSLSTRLGVFEAGQASAADPEQTVTPQKRR